MSVDDPQMMGFPLSPQVSRDTVLQPTQSFDLPAVRPTTYICVLRLTELLPSQIWQPGWHNLKHGSALD
jgi:hypothetical protein